MVNGRISRCHGFAGAAGGRSGTCSSNSSASGASRRAHDPPIRDGGLDRSRNKPVRTKNRAAPTALRKSTSPIATGADDIGYVHAVPAGPASKLGPGEQSEAMPSAERPSPELSIRPIHERSDAMFQRPRLGWDHVLVAGHASTPRARSCGFHAPNALRRPRDCARSRLVDLSTAGKSRRAAEHPAPCWSPPTIPSTAPAPSSPGIAASSVAAMAEAFAALDATIRTGHRRYYQCAARLRRHGAGHALPCAGFADVGVPKVMISTVASGNVRPLCRPRPTS